MNNLIKMIFALIVLMKILFIISVITACGSSKSSDSSNEEVETTKIEQEETTIMSMAIGSKSELPKCEKKNDTQLAYIKDEAIFYVCEDGQWASIEIENTTEVIGSNTWTNPADGSIWTLHSEELYARAAKMCKGEFSLPTKEQLRDAINRGILDVQTNSQVRKGSWTKEENSGAHLFMVLNSTTNQIDETWGGNSHVVPVFCVKN